MLENELIIPIKSVPKNRMKDLSCYDVKEITKQANFAFQISFRDCVVIKLTFVDFLNRFSDILSLRSSTV